MKGQAQRDEPLLQLIYRASLVILSYIHRFLFSATLPLTKHLFSRYAVGSTPPKASKPIEHTHCIPTPR
jgi:hypothetical protein